MLTWWYAHMMICSYTDMIITASVYSRHDRALLFIYWYVHITASILLILCYTYFWCTSIYIWTRALNSHQHTLSSGLVSLPNAGHDMLSVEVGPSWGRWSDHADSESPWRLLLFIYLTWCMIERDMSVLWAVICTDFWPVPVRLGGDYVDEISLLLSVLVCMSLLGCLA